jgi:glutamyl-tRNA synthetase
MQVIDPIAPRHTAVLKTRVVPITLSNGPAEVEYTTVPKHKKNPEVGVKTLFKGNRLLINQEDALAVKEGEEVCFQHPWNMLQHACNTSSAFCQYRLP